MASSSNTNPNAPTGIPITSNQIENFLKKNNSSVVIVDEAVIGSVRERIHNENGMCGGSS